MILPYNEDLRSDMINEYNQLGMSYKIFYSFSNNKISKKPIMLKDLSYNDIMKYLKMTNTKTFKTNNYILNDVLLERRRNKLIKLKQRINEQRIFTEVFKN